MKKEKLEEFVGKQVIVTLFDESKIIGELHKTREEMFKNDLNLYLPNNYYFLINPKSCLFRSSHIKKIKISFMNGLNQTN